MIDFDQVYERIIRPAVHDADLDPIRADEELTGGIIHKAMFQRLMLCDYAIADLTTANANVLYELGIRHGIRPHSTVLIFAKGTRLPFDVALLRGLPYGLDPYGRPANVDQDQFSLAERLKSCRDPVADSPLFQLITDWPKPDIARLKTDQFRSVVEYSNRYKARLGVARETGLSAIEAIERELRLEDTDPAIAVDLLLSYRAVSAWQSMVDLVPKLGSVLSRTVLVREQLGFALNRLGRRTEAEKTLQEIIEECGSSSETNGLLGRVYKDRWEDAQSAGHFAQARGFLRKAIATYLAGFEADMRDAYPGINAVTLMELEETVDAMQSELLPVIRYAVGRRLLTQSPDYWDHATVLELCVLARDKKGANESLASTLSHIRESWEPRSTARNLRLIGEARAKRGEDSNWISALELELDRASNSKI